MAMSLKEAFGIPDVVVRSRTLEYDGKEHYFRELSAADVERLWDVRNTAGEVDKAKAKGLDYRVLAEVVCDPAGIVLSPDPNDFASLPSKLKVELMLIAMDVNGMNPDKQKDGGDKPKN